MRGEYFVRNLNFVVLKHHLLTPLHKHGSSVITPQLSLVMGVNIRGRFSCTVHDDNFLIPLTFFI